MKYILLCLLILSMQLMGCYVALQYPGATTVGTQFLIPPDKVLETEFRAMGKSCSNSLLGLFSWGDASIQTAEFIARSEALKSAALATDPELKNEMSRIEKELIEAEKIRDESNIWKLQKDKKKLEEKVSSIIPQLSYYPRLANVVIDHDVKLVLFGLYIRYCTIVVGDLVPKKILSK